MIKKVSFAFQKASLPIKKISFTFRKTRLGISKGNSVFKSIAKAHSDKHDRIGSSQI
jgi:hypothetical protein